MLEHDKHDVATLALAGTAPPDDAYKEDARTKCKEQLQQEEDADNKVLYWNLFNTNLQ